MSPHSVKTRYAELICHTNFSLLRGASHPDELVARAAEWDHHALAITDDHTLAGVVRAHQAGKEHGLKIIIGAWVVPLGGPPVALYATNRRGYAHLARLLTEGKRRAPKGDCHLTIHDVLTHADGLIAVACAAGAHDPPVRRPPHKQNAGPSHHPRYDVRTEMDDRRDSSVLPPRSDRSSPPVDPDRVLSRYAEAFGDRLYLAASAHRGADDDRVLDHVAARSRATGIPMVAVNDVHYHDPSRRYLQDVLTCIREHRTLADAGTRLFANAERHLKTPRHMRALFHRYPGAVERTVDIADRCSFSLDELRYEYPEELAPDGMTPLEYLARLTWSGARRRYPQGLPPRVRALVDRELAFIRDLSYERYFLTVWDLVRFARSRGILCQGRGSAANSAVCYCLGVTAVDPDRIDLLFERFISRERDEPPDIDVDFEHERREEVFQYIYEKYGRDRAGIVAEVITYRSRSAVRDVGKALGLSADRVDLLAKKLKGWGRAPPPEEAAREAGLDPRDPSIRRLTKLVGQIIGFPRHLSQHVGGFVMTRGPLCEMVPIGNAAMPDRTFIEWDKDDIDALGILKVDCLALGMLTAVRKALDGVRARRRDDAPLTLSTIPPEDPAVYDMIRRADTVGVFQIESRAQMSMLPRLRPRCFYDLVIEVAIVRPGPIQGGMVHPYLRRRSGREAVVYPNEAIRAVLHKTLGVPLFQEQAMRLAVVAGGFTPGEADQLRRAMGAWRRKGTIDVFRRKLMDGMRRRGFPEKFARQVFEQVRGFGEYGFPESHAASFALLVYASAWLKRYHPAAFTAALLNSQPMGFYAPAQLVRDAREHGVIVRGVDVSASHYDCTLEDGGPSDPGHPVTGDDRAGARDDPSCWGKNGPALRLGFRLIKGISAAQVEGVVRGRAGGSYHGVADLADRSGAPRGVLARLAAAGACASMGLCRRDAVWGMLALSDPLPLFAGAELDEETTRLPRATLEDEVVSDYDHMGVSLTAHPMSFVRERLNASDVVECAKTRSMKRGQWARVAGLVLVRQRPSTASGIVFVTLEDETGIANLIVKPRVYDQYRAVARNAVALVAHGRIERQGDVIHINVRRLEDVSSTVGAIRGQSRDFH